MAYSLNETPSIKILIPAIFGILLYDIISISFVPIFVTGLFFTSLLLVSRRKQVRFHRLAVFTTGLSLFGLITIFFLLSRTLADHRSHKSYFDTHYNQTYQYEGVIRSIKLGDNNSSRLIVSLKRILISNDSTEDICGKVSIYIKDSLLPASRSDRIIFRSQLNEPQKSKNPYGFNYAEYLARQNVFATSYLKIGDFTVIKRTGITSSIFSFSKRLADNGDQILRTHLCDTRLAVANSLLLGDRSQLDDATSAIFSNTGSMHVLAVSGLHVGMVYLLLSFLLAKVPAKKAYKSLLMVSLIFIYAIVTGLSPSVVRASIMFAIIEIAGFRKLDTNILNSVAFSALLMLLTDPFYIYSVGFQLSYVALTGILIFYEPIRSCLNVDLYPLEKLWQITAVSIAAQLSTFPLTLYYFDQFPVYFFLSNIIVIPAATMIIPMGLLLFTTSFQPQFSNMIGDILEFTISVMIDALSWINSLPVSVIDSISVSTAEVCLLYTLIVSLYIYYSTNWQLYVLIVFFMVLMVISLIDFHENVKQYNKSALVIYKEYRSTHMDFHQGKQLLHITDGKPGENEEMSSYRVTFDLDIDTMLELDSNATHILVKLPAYNILVFNKEARTIEIGTNIKYLLIRNNAITDLNRLKRKITFEKIVCDATNSYTYDKFMKGECNKLGIDYISILKAGGRVMN
ncbi:MAG: ComEC/Rec2 family competence protein [Bacteroidia bacterium]|nr:ComEC/Rec2 family competence protein [Bacteroidia bacterium]